MEQLIAVFDAQGMSRTQYDQVINDLERAGAGAPKGRLTHFAAPKEDGFTVIDVWESRADLEHFAGVLFPILARNGVEPPAPDVRPLHNRIDA